MSNQLEDLREQILSESLDTAEAIESFRIKYLGQKRGRINGLMKEIPGIEPARRKEYGQQVNQLKALATSRLAEAQQGKSKSPSSVLRTDPTLPGRRPLVGSEHPISQTRRDIVRIFERYGFAVEEGTEIEDEWHNFTALNFPPNHPARDMQDTLFVRTSDDGDSGVLLRTHTSPVQIRALRKTPPPLRLVVPGLVYRNEAISYKSYFHFNQVEGLYVDRGVSLADLKHILNMFARAMFGDDVRMRFRPSFFPFTEPSGEVDIWWESKTLKGEGRWLEILGCGMVDPNVLKAVDVDPEEFTGYAFGMGIERIAMLRHDINDIRLLYENDVRLLQQF